MTGVPTDPRADSVSRSRYERERRAREEAEALLEAKSRALFEANENLERQVAERTAALTRALAAAEDASAMRGRFLAVMSHEIRTPLGGLFGILQILRTAQTTDELHDLLEAAAQATESLKRIVDDALDLSALDAGQMRFECGPVDLRALVDGVCALLGPRAVAKGLALSVSIADAVPRRFLGDAARLHQVLTNLCDNAMKFSDRGVITLAVDTCLGPMGDALRITVRDEGPGIGPADLPRLFLDFGQLDTGLTKHKEGTGLGLSICRRIVEGMGGRIGVDSTPGRGSAFWFEIAARAAPPERKDRPEAPPSGQPRSRLSGRHILVAEDNPISRKVIGGYLATLDAEHDVATDGAEAVRLAASRCYDLILMDVAMPGIDGITATRAIRAGNGPSCHAPIIGFTAHVMPTVRADCMAAAMTDVLAKPVALDDFADCLDRHISGGMEEPLGRRAVGRMATTGEALGDPKTCADLVDAFRADFVQRMVLMRDAARRGERGTRIQRAGQETIIAAEYVRAWFQRERGHALP